MSVDRICLPPELTPSQQIVYLNIRTVAQLQNYHLISPPGIRNVTEAYRGISTISLNPAFCSGSERAEVRERPMTRKRGTQPSKPTPASTANNNHQTDSLINLSP